MPVQGKTKQDIVDRAVFFQQALDLQIAAGSMSGIGLAVHPQAATVLAEMYYALSEAYKKRFLTPNHRTDHTKIAAITCIAIAYFNPIRPVRYPIENARLLYVNQLLALRASCGIIKHPFHIRSADEIRRWCRGLSQVNMPSLDPMRAEVQQNNGIVVGTWDLNLTRSELAELHKQISFFTVLEGLRIYSA